MEQPVPPASLVRKNKEIKKKPEQKKVKQMTKKDTKSRSHTTKEEQVDVETKRRSSEVHHHTAKNKQDGVEAKERATLCIHFSRIGRSIKQELNGEGSYSLDLKR